MILRREHQSTRICSTTTHQLLGCGILNTSYYPHWDKGGIYTCSTHNAMMTSTVKSCTRVPTDWYMNNPWTASTIKTYTEKTNTLSCLVLAHTVQKHLRFQMFTWDSMQNICASSCWNRLTLVRPERAPLISFRCRTPKSASRKGSSEPRQKQCQYTWRFCKVILTWVETLLDKYV